jgi:hypothetical protein
MGEESGKLIETRYVQEMPEIRIKAIAYERYETKCPHCVYSGCGSNHDKPPVSKCGYRRTFSPLLFGENGGIAAPSNAHNR